MVTVIHPRDPTVLWKSETFYWETQDQIQVDRELQGEQMTRTKLGAAPGWKAVAIGRTGMIGSPSFLG